MWRPDAEFWSANRAEHRTSQPQARCAELLGKEAAVWLPSRTMANQVALRTLTRPGDEAIASRESHVA